MEVVPAADVPLALPFARSNVQEWSHLDQLTGVLQQGRVQAHHWASATRAYGKVVDSRRVANASGGVEQRRHQQVEVFQERGPGGSRLHVVRASRLSTSSSSTTTTSGTAAAWRKAPAFDNLQLPLNPLDSSPQKTRASVGRSGSIGGRRPPSRPRSLVGKSEATAAEAISEEHRDHDDDLEIEVAAPRIEASTATSSEDEDGGGGGHHDRSPASGRRHSHSGVARKKSSSTEDLHCATPDEDGPAEVGSSSGGSGDDWRRDARVRRSLQFPGKAALGSPRLERPELPAFKSGSALRGLEALESVFRRGATIADSVNRTLADGGAGGDDALDVDSLAGHLRQEQQQMASSEEEGLGSKAAGKAAGKRHSFVTVEKLKEVRGRLRRLGSPPSDEASADSARSAAIAEERDDGIVTEEPDKREDCGPSPRVRSFVYGTDAAASGARKTVPGTGSLESRTSNRSSSSSGSRSEEWYNRRKSYGFEQVHEQGREAQLYGSPFRDKSKVESSTDSGICRSSETVTPWGRLVGSRTKTEDSHAKAGASSHIPVIPLRASHSIAINKASISLESSDTQRNSVLSERQDDDSAHQRGRTTVVTLGSKCEQRNVDFNNRNSGDSSLHNVSTYDNSDDEKPNHRRFSEPVTITIPITRDDSAVQNDALSNVEQKKQFYRKLSERPLSSSEGNKPFVVNIKKKEPNDLSSLIDKRNSFSSDSTQPLLDPTPWRKTESWKSAKQEEGEMKRHSIAVDPRYVKGGTNHIMSFSHMSQNDNSEQAFTRISASELAKKFDSLSVSRKEQSQSTLQNGVRQFSTGINVSFVQNGFVRNEEEDEELSSNQMNIKKQKKVEFCKTEVHFVADSGRVNIVETDEKPPPTNMFRRRKRNNTATTNLQASDPNKSNLPQVRFGDSPYEKKLLGGNDSSVSEVTHTIHVDIANDAKVATTSPAKEISQSHIPANFQHDADKEDHIFTQANATISAIVKTEGNESPRFDSENSDAFQMQASTDKDNMPRSILKNYRKPRPFLLGENDDFKPKAETEEGKQEEKWGIRLRPVQNSEQGSTTAMWRSQVSVSTTAFDVPQPQRQVASISSVDHNFRESENELQRQLRLLRPAHKKADVESFSPSTQAESRSRSSPPLARSFGRETEDKGIQVTVGPAATDGAQLSSWTVAERIRQVEEMRKVSGEVKGFSTRINFGAGEATVIEPGSSDEQQTAGQKSAGSAFEKTSASKAPWSPRQEAEDEKEQGSRNRGLVVRISKADQQGKQQQQQQEQQRLPKNFPSKSDGKTAEELKKTTTTITIDLGSPGTAEGESRPAETKRPPVKPERTRRKQQTEVLQSPSLIMKTIRNPSCTPGEKGEASPRAKDGGGEKTEEEAVARQRAQAQAQGAGSTRSQLAALKELYYSGVASEDSADEEVRSYMSAGGDDSDRASELSGSWSRVRAFRNMNKYKTGYLRTAHEEEVRQLPTARPTLPTHDSGRLRSVETFVSTRSGHPKITSISLHYEGDATPADTSKFQSVHTPPKDPDSATPLSASSPSDTRAEKHHQAKVGMRAEKAGLCDDQTLYKQTAPPHQKDAAHKIYEVAAKVRAPISYTERCYGDGESGSMSRRSRKTQENDRTYVVERKRFELQKEKYAAERDGLVTGKDSANEDGKCATPRGSNTFVKEKVGYKSGKIDARRQIVEAEMCEEVKFTGTRERRSVSPEKAFSKDADTAAQKSETLKSTSTVSVEEDEYCEQDVSDDSESAEETYGSIADKKIPKRISPIYDNVCETGDRPEARKKAAPDNGRQISGKSSAVVKGQSASSSRKVTDVEKRSSRKTSGSASGKRRSESPVYENREIICMEKDRKVQQRTRQEQRQHETAMLEELTRAADQILQAVNGYSDDDSNRPSSAEDEDRGRRHRRGQPRSGGGGALCTISEAPQRKGHRQPAGAAEARAAARRPQRASKPQLGPTSSTSSVDSVSERRAAAAAASAARRERAARLVQRASSREQLLQARASSSEDALSSLEAEERRPRPPPPRRQRPAGTSASTAATARAQPAAQGHKRLSSGEAAVVSKTADRSTAKKSLTSHRLRESTKERITRTVSAKRDLAEVKHNTSRATTDKLPGSSHGLLPSSSKNKNERCISERRTVVAVMPLRPSPSSNVKKIKTTSSRTEGTQVKPVK
ncbi:uncharacterized protein LOC124718985 [Schistocerca piceifrons]|uniref:uncharacterized protein LOC124718985 n=1 Tax=Schistocerca piceifrons TaxID=274613 RepID=UPI001F5EA48A|nr:uncharacterized protein LOC124718985 [Schistocerca piceifrons]